jgi:hypothetical protein
VAAGEWDGGWVVLSGGSPVPAWLRAPGAPGRHEMVPSAVLAGEVLLGGEDIYSAGRRITDTRRRIGMVFQKPNPFPAISIAENVTPASSSPVPSFPAPAEPT